MQRRSRPALWIILVALLAPAAVAGGDPAPPMPANKPVTPKVICKNEPTIGTKIKKKTCRTQAVADAERQASQEWLKKIQNDGALQKNAE